MDDSPIVPREQHQVASAYGSFCDPQRTAHSLEIEVFVGKAG